MELYRELSQIPSDFGPSVITIGNFDGVHIGHKEVIGQVTTLARQHQLVAAAVSFDPHPMKVHCPQVEHVEIMGQEDRQRYLASLGIDAYILLNYTHDFAQQSPQEFVVKTFVEALQARYVVVGEDVRFGKDNAGSIATLRALGAEYGFEVISVVDLLDGSGQRYSSTRIREYLTEGAVDAAASVLGRHHMMRGEVVHGLARGRELGFPTANMSVESVGYIPADGVYAGWLIDEAGIRHPAAISIGTNPTFEGIEATQVEAHVMCRPDEPVENFNLYGQHVVIEFVKNLRPMVAYTGPEALIAQIEQDVIDAKKALGIAV